MRSPTINDHIEVKVFVPPPNQTNAGIIIHPVNIKVKNNNVFQHIKET